MAHGSAVNKIVEALETLKKKKVGQYYENVVDLCADEYGWTETETNTAIEAAKEQSVIKEVTSSNHKKAYRVTNPNFVKIQQSYKPVFSGSSINDADDFLEFKKLIHSEILSLKAQVEHKINSPVQEPEPEQEPDYMKALIRSLQDRVISLKRQLQQKQWTIEKLLDRPKEDVNKPEPQPQTSSCAPMGGKISCRTADRNKGAKESSVGTNERKKFYQIVKFEYLRVIKMRK